MTSQAFRKGKQGFTQDGWVWLQGNASDMGARPILIDMNDAGPAAGAYVLSGATNVADPVFTTAAAHGLAVGDMVTIWGMTGATALNNTVNNPRWVVDAVPSSTTFTVNDEAGNNPGAPGAVGSGGFLMNLSKSFLSEVAGVAGCIISRGNLLTAKASTNGVLSAANGLFPSVAAGADPAEAILLVRARALHTDASDLADNAQRLIHFIHEGTGFPFSGQGNNVDLIWASQGIVEI